MNGFLRTGFGVLGAAMLMMGSLPAPALAQGVAPDLELKSLGVDQNDRTLVRFEVINVGKEWTKETSVTVELSKDGTKLHEQSFPIPDLNPPQLKVDGTLNSYPFTYKLPAGHEVGGHSIVGTLKQALSSDENGSLPETNLDNNVAKVKFMTKANNPPPAPAPAGPEHLQVGMHTKTFTAVKVDSRSRQDSGGICAPFKYAGNPDAGAVGWSQTEQDCRAPSGLAQGWHTEIAQTGVTFDLTILDEVPNLRIKSAILKFDEAPTKWKHGDGSPRNVKTCVAAVVQAASSLVSVPQGSLFPSEPLRTQRPAGFQPVKAWDVQDDVRLQLASDKNTPARFGYILKGENVTLTGDDDAACMSTLSNIRLEVEFETLP
jgi:hypothetical protein